MPSSDHASGVLSRKAKRLDSRTRHGTLAHAHLKVFLVSLPSFLSSPIFIAGFLGLDIESLSTRQRSLLFQEQYKKKSRSSNTSGAPTNPPPLITITACRSRCYRYLSSLLKRKTYQTLPHSKECLHSSSNRFPRPHQRIYWRALYSRPLQCSFNKCHTQAHLRTYWRALHSKLCRSSSNKRRYQRLLRTYQVRIPRVCIAITGLHYCIDFSVRIPGARQ